MPLGNAVPSTSDRRDFERREASACLEALGKVDKARVCANAPPYMVGYREMSWVADGRQALRGRRGIDQMFARSPYAQCRS